MKKEINHQDAVERGGELAIKVLEQGPIIAKAVASTLIEFLAEEKGVTFAEFLNELTVGHDAIVDEYGTSYEQV